MEKGAAYETLIQHGKGLADHDYKGLCPDGLEGPDIRDPNCMVCQALIVVEGDDLALVSKRINDWIVQREEGFSRESLPN